jgi:hypothetical protein
MGAFMLRNRDPGLLRIDASLGFREGDATKTRTAESEGLGLGTRSSESKARPPFVDALH